MFEDLARPIVDKSLGGYNGTVFAFGQTASGKTHTLMGRPSEPGLTWLAVDAIFETIQDTMDTEFLIRMSYVEIYNEELKVRAYMVRRTTYTGLAAAGLMRHHRGLDTF